MKRLLVFYCVFNLGLISKKEPSRRLLWQKRDYSRDSRQFISHCLNRYRPLFSSADKFFVRQSYRIFFCVEQPLIIVRPSADFFFFRSVISRSTFRHLNSFFFQCWLANTDCRPKMDRRSTGHSGRFWHRFWTTYRKPITVNIYLGRKALDMRTISSKNWSYTHVVAREYSAIA